MSNSFTYSTEVELTTFNCGECGGVYAINERRRKQCQRKGTGWHCPYCQVSWGYFGDSVVDNLKRELREARDRMDFERRRAQREAEGARRLEYKRRAAVGKLTKIQNKIARGECPCCGKRFQNLLKHLQTKHAEWVDEHGGLKLLEHLPETA